jgi:hypothetical protein
MKTLNNKFIIYLSLLFLITIGLFSFNGFETKSAKAEVLSVQTTLFSPSTPLEYTELNSPKDFCYFDGNLAVIEGQDVVIHFKDGTSRTISNSGLTALKQIKIFKDDLLVSSNGPLYVISLEDYSISALTYDSGNGNLLNVGANYFDLNDHYLVTAYGEQIDCYDISSDVLTKVFYKMDANGDEPITINQNGEIFYVSGEAEKTLVKRVVENPSHREDLTVFTTIPSLILADNQNVYLASAGNISRTSVLGGEVTSLPFSEKYKEYDLGYIPQTTEISGMVFRNGNILLSSATLNTVQEFTVIDGALNFTGYAIANGKTAYNRINPNATNIDQFNGAIAVLDGHKLTVIKDSNVGYDENNYYNYILGDKVFNRVAIGNGTVLLSNVFEKKIVLIDYNAKTTIFEHTFDSGNNLLDVYYQNGTYYVSELKTGTGNDVNVYSILESNPEVNSPIITATSEFDVNSVMTVDIYKNVYLSNKDRNKIFVFRKTAEGYENQSLLLENVTPAKKLFTDLNGRLFAITDNVILYYSEGTEYTVSTDLSDIKSLALSYDRKTVYAISSLDERVYKIDDLKNASADKFDIPDEFGEKLTSASLDSLKIFSVKDGANLFKVQGAEEHFNYLGVYNNFNNEYTLVSSISYKIDDLPSTEYSLLLGYDDQNNPVYVVVLTSDLSENPDGVIDPENDGAFVATDVSVYFLPMITETDDYCIEFNGQGLRLAKGTQLDVIKELTFLNKTFYFVKLTVDGTEINGYVPKDFTTLTLYSNPTLNDINEVLENENDHTLRNALVTAVVATSVFITSLYFILRKKQG